MPTISGSGGILGSTTQGNRQTENIQIETVGLTEATVTLAANVVAYKIRARGQAQLKIAFSTGQTATNYGTISPGASWLAEDLVPLASRTIYLLSNKANTEVEIYYATNS